MEIDRFLDEDGKLKQFPTKRAMKELACAWLADNFDYDRQYTEKDVNTILDQVHSFGDYFLLRREMVESGWLQRLPDGSRYWKGREDEA